MKKMLMRDIFFALFFSLVLMGCDKQKLTHQNIVTNYYNAFNASDFNSIKTYINDSITITEGDYVMSFNQSSFYEQFKWDSVFKPSYKIVELKETNNQIDVTVAVNSLRFEFLKNNPLTCRHKISFDLNKISKIEALECLEADWNVWQRERDTLIAWTNKNHPELDGFIHDLTMNGAIQYLKAIELYLNSKNTINN